MEAKVRTQSGSKVKVKEPSLTEQMKSLIKKEAEAWFDVSVTAFKIYQNMEWEKLGYTSAKDYVTAEFDALGFSYTTFMYRVQMGKAIDTYDIKREHISALGWSKFKEIASFVLAYELNADELSNLVDEAKDLTVKELKEKISSLKSEKTGIKRERTKIFSFKLLESQAAVLSEAIEIASQLAETDNAGVALVYICTDFLLHRTEDPDEIEQLRKKVVSLFDAGSSTITESDQRANNENEENEKDDNDSELDLGEVSSKGSVDLDFEELSDEDMDEEFTLDFDDLDDEEEE